jgi:hypothetical protein
MPTTRPALAALAAAAVLAPALHPARADWTNNGGNAGRNGSTAQIGPDSPQVLWTGGRSSVIAWQPITAGNRLFLVRQTGFPPAGEPNGSPVFATNLDTGAELWRADIPFNPGDWTTWLAGARDGRVYAARSGNGASVSARMHALDQATGAVLWVSAEPTNAGAYDGVVFADNGDLVVASFRDVWRIRAANGATAWRASRACPVSGSCGGAIGPGGGTPGVYVVDSVPGGNVIKKFDLATGQFLYQSPVLPGFTIQNTPFVGPDGTVYLNRTQNNASVDTFYAFQDTGSALVERWSTPARWTTFSEFAATNDAVFMIAPGEIIQKRSAATGAVLASSQPFVFDPPNITPRMAIDALGRLFFSNGAFTNGRFYAYNPDLSERWSIPAQAVNIGAPAIGQSGTLVIARNGTSVTAYRTTRCLADWNGDGVVDFNDLLEYLNDYNAQNPRADLNADGVVDFNDLLDYINLYNTPCP